ncbi:MAG: heme ABC transporter ATP-binding protein [Verrucomicrobiota bacterium]
MQLGFAFARAPAPLFEAVDWHASPGRVEALLGPNGSGKTTLLRLLSGELTPSAGRVLLDGRSLSDWPTDALARRRAFLSQSPRLDFAFSVREVLLMGRAPYVSRSDRADDAAIIDQLVEELDLHTLAERPFPALSRGEKQRVQLGRVLAQLEEARGQSHLLFLDEPVNHLDLAHQHLALAVARRRAARGHSVIVVLHDLNLALRYADTATILDRGRIAARGDPERVLTRECLASVFGVEGALVQATGSPPHLVVTGPAASGRGVGSASDPAHTLPDPPRSPQK